MMFLPSTTRSSANVMPRSAIASERAVETVGRELVGDRADGMKTGSGGVFSVIVSKTPPDPFTYLICAGSSRGDSRCTINSASRYADAAMMNTGR